MGQGELSCSPYPKKTSLSESPPTTPFFISPNQLGEAFLINTADSPTHPSPC